MTKQFRDFLSHKYSNLILLGCIVLLSFIARIAFINSFPARLTHDEMSIGYNAFSLLKTAKDEWGRFLPLSFQAFGDYKLPGYIYSTVPFVYLFGLNVIALKLPSILAGTLSALVLYKIALLLQKKH